MSSNFFIDSNVENDNYYTYKIGIFEGPFEGSYSNEATVLTPPIPVELTSFIASVNRFDVYLNWSTATETNNYGFKVFRSTQNHNNKWNEIGFVSRHGTTTERQSYIFIDEFVPLGKYQYRLKQIDYNGTFEYSDIVEVEVGSPTEFSLQQNYPNPFNPSTKISFTISDMGFTTLKIYDVIGNGIATLVNEEIAVGYYEIEFNSSSLSSGIYYYRLQAGNFVATKKMILLK